MVPPELIGAMCCFTVKGGGPKSLQTFQAEHLQLKSCSTIWDVFLYGSPKFVKGKEMGSSYGNIIHYYIMSSYRTII